jgi:hypothetical protein
VNTATAEAQVLELIPSEAQPSRPVALTQAATPAMLLQIAVERGADLAYVEKLMELQERHQANAARAAHNEAFAAFKGEAVQIIKNKLITDGPLKGKKHADLFDVVSAVSPALSKHGLSISWKLTKDEKDWIEVTCYLKHAAGFVESVSMGGEPDKGPGRNAIQARCSVKTYLERYTATAILGMAATDADDDGDGGSDGNGEVVDALLRGFQSAAMEGGAKLRAHYDATQPPEDWWRQHSKALKQAAKVADDQGSAR